jgi:hypothetical protein
MMTIDETALAEARKAQERLLELQRDAERARVDYHHEIRRLHAAGGSLREIADALGLSHQRVHQIVDAEEPASAADSVLQRMAERVRKLRVGGFLGFAEPARETVVAATAQASGRGSREVEARDILVAVLREPGESTAAILTAAGADVQSFDLGGEGAPAEQAARRRLGFAPSAKSALERGLREAMALGDKHISREHLLLGVLSLEDADVDALLERAGTTREALRNATLTALAATP